MRHTMERRFWRHQCGVIHAFTNIFLVSFVNVLRYQRPDLWLLWFQSCRWPKPKKSVKVPIQPQSVESEENKVKQANSTSVPILLYETKLLMALIYAELSIDMVSHKRRKDAKMFVAHSLLMRDLWSSSLNSLWGKGNVQDNHKQGYRMSWYDWNGIKSYKNTKAKNVGHDIRGRYLKWEALQSISFTLSASKFQCHPLCVMKCRYN